MTAMVVGRAGGNDGREGKIFWALETTESLDMVHAGWRGIA